MNVIHMDLKSLYPFLDVADLTVYVPEDISREYPPAGGPRPTVLVLPGGGYQMCSLREAEPVALDFLAANFTVAVLMYTNGQYAHPSQLLAVAAAVEQLTQHAKEWRVDPDKIALCGFSAGAHCAGFYGNCYDLPEVQQKIKARPVAATVLGYPVISTDPAYYHGSSFAFLSGHDLPMTEEESVKFSLDKQVDEKTPPACIWATATDTAVAVQNSLMYARALADNHVPFELHVFPAGHHGLSTVDDRVNPPLEPAVTRCRAWVASAVAWLRETL